MVLKTGPKQGLDQTKIKEILMKKQVSFWALMLLLMLNPLFAGEADVIDVTISKTGSNTYAFRVTVLHKDTGWDHYANKWEILDQQGTVLGTRILYHPHVDEQPFTRSLSGVKIPRQVNTITVRAHDSVHGYGGKVRTVNLAKLKNLVR